MTHTPPTSSPQGSRRRQPYRGGATPVTSAPQTQAPVPIPRCVTRVEGLSEHRNGIHTGACAEPCPDYRGDVVRGGLIAMVRKSRGAGEEFRAAWLRPPPNKSREALKYNCQSLVVGAVNFTRGGDPKNGLPLPALRSTRSRLVRWVTTMER